MTIKWTQEEYEKILRDGYKTHGERSDISQYVGSRKLNLGCGTQLEPVWNGWLNADINRNSAAQVIFDARKPWPFQNRTFDTIQSIYVLHHFCGEELFKVVYNIGLALSFRGHLIGTVPRGCTGHPMQTSFWTESTPRMFDRRIYRSTSNFYTSGWDQGLPMHLWDTVKLEYNDSEIRFVMRKIEDGIL